jgi:hypothetical protein
MAPPNAPLQSCQVFLAEDIFVTHGVNTGDGLGLPDHVCLGDQYEIDHASQPLTLTLNPGASPPTVENNSRIGTFGEPITTIACYTLMDDEAYQTELLLLTVGGRLCALPLSPMTIATPYTLLRVDSSPAANHLSDALCLSFGRGTRILLASGEQRPIETLEPGDLVLTRDHGPQPLRWKGQTTTRAIGAFAPVIITADTLGNAGDLIVSQQHRMFVYQRDGRFDQPELLVQARHMVNHDTIFLREGGFVDYFALVFDAHEIIYAEGIPVESLLVTEATPARLPPDLQDRFPSLRQRPHTGLEIGPEAARALRPKTRE